MEERALYCRRSSVNSSELEKNVNEFLKDYSESPVSGPDGAEKSGVGLMDGKWKDYLCSFVGKRKSDIEIKLREILDSGILSENFDIGMHGKLVIMFSMQN